MLLLVVFDLARDRAGPTAAASTVLAMSLLPALAFEWDGGAITSYADIPLGLFWGGGLLLVMKAPWSVPEALAGALLLAAGALSKPEGLLIGGLAMALVLVRAARRAVRMKRVRPVRAAGFAAALFLAGALLSVSWRAAIPNRNSETWDDVTPSQLVHGLRERLPDVLHFIRIEMTRPEVWSGFWWLAPAVFVLGAPVLARPSSRPLLVAIAGALILYAAAYAASGWAPKDLVHPTWNRFLSQLAVPLYLLFAHALGDATSLLPRP